MDIAPGDACLPFVGRDVELGELDRALRASTCIGTVITGAGGIGKSRLVEEFLGRSARGGDPADVRPPRAGAGAASRRRHIVRVRATRASASVALSALTPLLPHGARPEEPAAFFRQVRDELAARRAAGAGRPVVAIDDVHLLDASSSALLALLLAEDVIFLLATLPDGADWPDPLRSLWRRGALRHVALPALDIGQAGALLRAALGAPITTVAVRALWTSGQGNPLHLREALRAAIAEDRLGPAHGIWCLKRPLADSLEGVSFDERIDLLSPDRRAVLELLALCGPIALCDLPPETPADALADLEAAHLVGLRRDDRRERLALAQPAHAPVLRAGVGRLRARAILLGQAARLRAHGAHRTGDALTLACWELAATGTADSELLVRGAAEALGAGDVETMCRLARAALRHGPNVRAGVMLGEALGQRGEFAEGIAVLEQTFAAARGADAHPAGLALAVHHFYGPGDLPRALAVLRETARRAGPSPALSAWTATILGATGQVARAGDELDAGPGLGADDRPGPDLVLHLQARLRVELARARPEDAIRTARAAYAAHRELTDRTEVFYPARSSYLVAWALLEAGRLDEAERVLIEGLDELLRAPVPALVVWFGWVHGRIALDRGRLRLAATLFAEARAQAHVQGHRFAEQRALAGLVLARAQAGQTGAEADELALTVADGESALCGWDTRRAYAWALHCRGYADEAHAVLRAGAASARDRGDPSAALTLEHDLVRWGDRAAAIRVIASADVVQGPHAAARAAHARAVATADPHALSAVADQWAAHGAVLLAAECLARSARFRRHAHDARAEAAARRAESRAFLLVAECEDAATPALATLSTAASLSVREHQIALLAAQGHTSREIAATCGLSIRTVDNTLGRAYRKVGVRDRHGLRSILPTARTT
ncbi:AAA family ATPase [Embleya sp. NPDC127516]|uniref:helix-turn-helix transcriptional regulator n=1 Tax=Embleya sp. NPDC127516 TaxID=3363990 RepID=UPI003828A463